MKYNYRYIARVVIQAQRPIAVGSGDKELTTDRPVAKDVNGLPYIPGTSLTGVIRNAIYDITTDEKIIDQLNDIFGYQNENKQEDSLGSRLALSSAHLMGKGIVFDGLCAVPNSDNYEIYKKFRNLPVRQHVRMSHKGAADTVNKGKFDEEVLYKGSRLVFELELKGTTSTHDDDLKKWHQILDLFCHPDFRIGGGSNRGFGRIDVINIREHILNLEDKDQRKTYLNHSTFLGSKFEGNLYEIKNAKAKESNFDKYLMNLKPDRFYLFSSGKKTDVADMNPVMEQVIEWDTEGNPRFSDEMVLVPASSVKGAISHRLAYHYNRLAGNFADKLAEQGKTTDDCIGENNLAVRALFGSASDYSDDETGQKGHVLFSDVYRPVCSFKKLDHVAIDRYTGGTIEGALFDENTVHDFVDKDNQFILELKVKKGCLEAIENTKERGNVLEAFHLTIADIKTGMLPLGGGTMRGNGIFKEVTQANKN